MHGGSAVGRGVTTVGDDGAFYVGAHVGHDCVVGDHVILTNAATLGGHVTVGRLRDHGRAVGRRSSTGASAATPSSAAWPA